MSRENVELHRRALEAFNRGDLDELLVLMDDDVEVVARTGAIEGGYHGHEGVRRWWQNLHDAFPDWSVEAVEIRDLGETTLAKVHIQGHGVKSGAPFTRTTWQAARLRDGRAIWVSNHDTEAEALEAAGLSE